MNQDEVDRAEWEDAANWGGPDWLCVYFSKKDSRVWVRKRIPWMGWTLNLAHTAGVLWMIGIVIAAILAVIVVMVIAARG